MTRPDAAGGYVSGDQPVEPPLAPQGPAPGAQRVTPVVGGGATGWRRHTLKTHPPYFADVVTGVKTFEVRRDDRGFMPGDLLVLREFVPADDGGHYTGREIVRRVTYVLPGGGFGVEVGFVVLGLGAP